MNVILKKGTRGSFQQWDKNDYDLSVTRLQMTHPDGGFGLTLTPNTIDETSTKVDMTSRFLGLVGSLSPDEQNLNKIYGSQRNWFMTQIRGPYLIFFKSKESM